MKRLPAAIACVLVMAAAAVAVERFPPPEFTDHSVPETTQPAPKHPLHFLTTYCRVPESALPYVDLGILAGALALAVVLALKIRSRAGMVTLMVASLIYFGYLRGGCVCPIGAIQNVTLAIFDSGYVLPLSVGLAFLLPLACALVFGRAYCAAVCPLGAIQDLVVVFPLRIPSWLAGPLRLGAYVYLGAAVLAAATGSAFLICEYDPFLALFRLTGRLPMVIFGLSVLVVGMFVARPYCRFACPYGVLLGWLSRLSLRRVTITPTECIQCRLCENACPFGAIQPANADQPVPRRQGRGVLAAMLALLPVLVAAGATVGHLTSPALARLDPTVRLSERSEAAGKGLIDPADDEEATKADKFVAVGEALEEAHATAAEVRGKFKLGGALLGAFVGLVAGAKLVRLSMRRTRTDYEADKGTCLACGRCWSYCPVSRNPEAAVRPPGDQP